MTAENTGKCIEWPPKTPENNIEKIANTQGAKWMKHKPWKIYPWNSKQFAICIRKTNKRAEYDIQEQK